MGGGGLRESLLSNQKHTQRVGGGLHWLYGQIFFWLHYRTPRSLPQFRLHVGLHRRFFCFIIWKLVLFKKGKVKEKIFEQERNLFWKQKPFDKHSLATKVFILKRNEKIAYLWPKERTKYIYLRNIYKTKYIQTQIHRRIFCWNSFFFKWYRIVSTVVGWTITNLFGKKLVKFCVI